MTRGRRSAEPLPPAFYAQPAEQVARHLLGGLLISTVGGQRTAGRIVEAEAYLGPQDPASHAAERIGRTARNASMFGPPGIAYVYRIYGLHWCLNAVTDEEGYPAAVLIRALEPLEGLETMRRRRWRDSGGEEARRTASRRTGRSPGSTRGTASTRDRDLARGPARLAEALGITGALDGHPLQEPPLLIARGEPIADERVRTCPRIGVMRARDWPLRFYVAGSPWVSRKA